MVWNRKHNIATITVSFAHRIWSADEPCPDVILGYNAVGRLSRVVLLDPRTLLPPDASERRALECVLAHLLRRRAIRQPDVDVLRSALDRAAARERRLRDERPGA